MSKLRKLPRLLPFLACTLVVAGVWLSAAPAEPQNAHQKLVEYLTLRQGNARTFEGELYFQHWQLGERYFAQLRPLLEQVTGQRPAYQCAFVWTAGNDEVPGDPVLAAHSRWLVPDEPAAAHRAALEQARQIRRHLLMFVRRNAVVDQRANIPGLGLGVEFKIQPAIAKLVAAQIPAAERADSQEFFRLALAHAAVLVDIEDQYGLSHRLLTARSRAEFEVLFALGQGAALWQTAQIARLLGAEDLFPLISIDPCQYVPPGNKAGEAMARMALERQRELARIGYRYYSRAGAPSLETLLSTPPQTLAELERAK